MLLASDSDTNCSCVCAWRRGWLGASGALVLSCGTSRRMSHGMFRQRLQRAPPMAYDLESVPEEFEEDPSLSEDEDVSMDNDSGETMAIHSPVADNEPVEGFDLQYDRSVPSRFPPPGQEQAAETRVYVMFGLKHVTKHLFSVLPEKSHNRFNLNSVGSSFTVGAYVFWATLDFIGQPGSSLGFVFC